jgi:hypothetical protein
VLKASAEGIVTPVDHEEEASVPAESNVFALPAIPIAIRLDIREGNDCLQRPAIESRHIVLRFAVIKAARHDQSSA